jgi:hypothetical protein
MSVSISQPHRHARNRRIIFAELYFRRGIEQIDGRTSGFEGDCMARTVIQIAADPSYLYALCNDGEIFRLVNHVWQPMAPIPQDDPRDTSAKPKPGFIQIADEPGG